MVAATPPPHRGQGEDVDRVEGAVSRCWGCCQENCGYSQCGCSCHGGDPQVIASKRAHEAVMSMVAAAKNAKSATISFNVLGTPAPKGSWRSVRRKDGKGHAFIRDNPRTQPWADSVAWAAKEATRGHITEEAVAVVIDLYLPRPKTVKRKRHKTKPDADKIVRNCLDAMTGIVWRDDSQVDDCHVRKFYADGRPPGAVITIIAEAGE